MLGKRNRLAVPTALLILFLCSSRMLLAQNALPASAEVEARAHKILSQMTVDEKLDYIGGYNSFYIRAIPRLGVPELKMSDGPMGTRNDGLATAYPSGIAMAATWDTELERQIGVQMGRDSRARGVHFLLAPAMNIYRSPLCGRNFEYFGEDPFLSSRMAVAAIQGIQSQGVIATAKHYMGNNQEWERYKVSSDIDERTMHEIYLPAFEASVKEGHVGAVMDSYNPVNGEHATQNYHLNTEILKQQWGFQGVLMSDWGAVTDGLMAATSGMDLEMPSAEYMNKKLLTEALTRGKITQATIDDKVLRILRAAIAFGFFEREQKDSRIALDNPEARPVVLKADEESVVMLKNNGLLPVELGKVRKIAVIGPNATPAVTGGGGSSLVQTFHAVSVLDGVKALMGDKAEVSYHSGVRLIGDAATESQLTVDEEGTKPGTRAEYFNNMELKGEPALKRLDERVFFNWGEGSYADGQPVDHFSARWAAYYTPKASGAYTFCISGDDGFRLFVDNKQVIEQWHYQGNLIISKELVLEAGHHYKIVVEYFENEGLANIGFGITVNPRASLEQALVAARAADVVVLSVGFNSRTESEGSDRSFGLPEEQQKLIAEVLAANKNVVVVLNAGGNVDMTPFLDKAAAVLHSWFPGQEGGTAVAEILLGKVNPSGKLPASFERRWEDNPVRDSYYDKENSRRVSYTEGVFMGYRYYDKASVKPLFPFGYGLSYTTFKYSKLKVTPLTGDKVSVTFTLTNTGPRGGTEIAQVYVGDGHTKVVRPVKELKGFARIQLGVGESKTVTVELDRRAFSYYDVHNKSWTATPGVFEVLVGSSSEQIELKGTAMIGE